jgi:hypothetical protein
MTDQPCPDCGEVRTGAFRFCRICGFDFDHWTPGADHDVAIDRDRPGAAPAPAFARIELFPPPTRVDDSSPTARGASPRVETLIGVVVIGGIVAVFLTLALLRPLG